MSRPDSLLSDAARKVIADVVSQLGRRNEAVRGLCAITESRQIKRGAVGPSDSIERDRQRLDDPDATAEEKDLVPLLHGDAYDRSEQPSYNPGEIVVQARLRQSTGAQDEIPKADFTFQKDPARLLSVQIYPPEAKGLVGLLMAEVGSVVTFEYVRGVPLTSELRMRVTSRGIGRLRFDHELITTVQYEACT